MKRLTLALLFVPAAFASAVPAQAQEFVKVDILAKFQDIPIAPVSASQAYTRAVCDPHCSVDRFFAPVEAEFGDMARRIEVLSGSISARPGANPFEGMDPAELQARVQAMSPEEQMRFAMELSRAGSAGGRPVTVDSRRVRDAVTEANIVQQAIGDDAIRQMDGVELFPMRVGRMQEELNRQHGEISVWEQTERSKLREPTPDESPEPYVAATRAIRLEAANRHIAAEDAFLRELSGLWREELQHQRTRFSNFQAKFAAIGYGEEASGSASLGVLIGVQHAMLEPVRALLGASRDSSLKAAEWWARKLALEAEYR